MTPSADKLRSAASSFACASLRASSRVPGTESTPPITGIAGVGMDLDARSFTAVAGATIQNSLGPAAARARMSSASSSLSSVWFATTR